MKVNDKWVGREQCRSLVIKRLALPTGRAIHFNWIVAIVLNLSSVPIHRPLFVQNVVADMDLRNLNFALDL